MAREELITVRLRDDFYKDGFYKVILSLVIITLAIVFLIAVAVYLYLAKPLPVNFKTDNEWRVLPSVPLDQPYIAVPDLIQWVSEALPASFTYDFVDYKKQLQNAAQYYTSNGWDKFLEHVNVYANHNSVQNSKLFINTYAGGAPFIVNQGLLGGKYAWWLQMPISINYISLEKRTVQDIVLQVLVVRVPTLNNLHGVGIENMLVTKQETGEKLRTQ